MIFPGFIGEAEKDHVSVNVLRLAHHIKRDDAHAVILPQQLNALRTNNRATTYDTPYTIQDYRIDPIQLKNSYLNNKSYTGGYTI